MRGIGSIAVVSLSMGMALCDALRDMSAKNNGVIMDKASEKGYKAKERFAFGDSGKSKDGRDARRVKGIKDRVVIGADGAFRHANFQRNVVCAPDGSRTVLELFLNRCAAAGGDAFLGTIVGSEVQYRTANEVRRDAEGLAAFLCRVARPGSIVGIYSVNRYEWVVAELASYMAGCVNVPLYSTFSPEDVRLILGETEMGVCVASADKARVLLESVLDGGSVPLKHVVLMDRDDGLVDRLHNAGVRACYFGEVAARAGTGSTERYPGGDDLATVCYTSGTSGRPKGVMLTHRNFVSCVAGISRGSTPGEMIALTRDDVYLSYLPLAHVMERVCVNISLAAGSRIVFYRGNPKEIKGDYAAAKPTFIISVPRVLNLFRERIEEQVQKKSFAVRWLFRGAMRYKVWRQGKGELKSRFFDWLVFGRVAQEFGGQIRGVLCGSAPLKKEVLAYMQAVFSCRVFQGYGQTENVGAGLVQPLDHYEYDNVGIPYPANEVRLGEMSDELREEYGRRYAGKAVGELQLRGDNVTQGYYKRPEETRRAFTDDGWLRTGDIAMYDGVSGLFSIIGRVKDGFKTSQGEYIDPEKLEVLYTDDAVVLDMCIPRRTDSDRITAVVVGAAGASDAEVLAHVRETGERLLKQRRITRLEIPQRVVVIRRGFETFEGPELMTPTAKKRRLAIERHFEREIAEALGIK